MATLMDPNIELLLQLFQPLFFFDPSEQFFPAAAEEVLAHQATESWTKLETHQRGTAVLLSALAATSYAASNVQAGVDDPNGAPVTFTATPPEGIGQPFPYNSATEDMFLDCAGWDDTTSEAAPGEAAYTTGSIEYLQPLFSALANAMNSGIPISTPDPAPIVGVPRATAPTIYAELDWAGRYPILDQERVNKIGGQHDFPATITPAPIGIVPLPPGTGPLTALNNYLALTYYLFYPAMEMSPAPDPSERIREGQWEAVTIFLKGTPNFGDIDKQGRPDFSFSLPIVTPNLQRGLTGLTPRFLVYSQGYGLFNDNFNPLSAEVRPWPGQPGSASMPVNLTGDFQTHPFVYVTAGTHRNLFTIDATVTPGPSSGPNTGLNVTGAALMGAAGSALGICVPLLIVPPPAGIVAAAVCAVIAAVIFIIGLLLFILSFLFPSSNPPSESPQSAQPGTQVARDDGPAALPPGLTSSISGSSNASSVTVPTLRLISEYGFDPTPPITTYPLPPGGGVEMPSWWTYPGRWGVRITPLASGQWDSGARRTDPFGRTRAYWNAYQLVEFIAASGDAQTL